ncbi:DUF692 family multinuclear iron-containing protein [Polyangium sp. 6x1]|uniref:multinuclear nonheme iron-dependent oxidase n=1 Tax=Polyangium sp. 6x1 TaxID=3042689 RepID=UPI002482A37A|nr:DUF692 family multinuclear iron-containing protein [Polyangium sp. 6x1]MDI1444039.1 DUF692 family protein [Polyangium sp. 6x1]
MKPRFPEVNGRLGLGVGMDLPWGAPVGFAHEPGRGDHVTDPVVRFLSSHAGAFRYLFTSFQPRSRNHLDPREYVDAYDDLFARIPAFSVRALHQTTFNLGALEAYDRSRIIDFTNALVDRYHFAWVNEDLGLWSIHGRPLPYPLPPYLTPEGLDAAIRNTAEVQEKLVAPLFVEFPGFSDGTSFFVGQMHAYDFFRAVVEETRSPATLDVGHLLSYQWLLGKRGEALFGELERLPLDHCFEIHLSGCAIDGDSFMDHHHGVLLDEQFELLRRLLPLCPNLSAITYEDPRLDAEGRLAPETVASFERLRAAVDAWLS